MERYIPVITKHYSCRVDIDDIIYIQQQQKKLAIVTDDEIYSYYEKIENVLDYLDKRFFRVMKKLVVNLDKISMVKEQQVHFKNGSDIYLGKDNYVRTKQKYTAYIRGLEKCLIPSEKAPQTIKVFLRILLSFS